MKKVNVLGAGHAGLIAARMLKREGFDVGVYEIQPELPLNHASVLRFRTDALQKALGVPLKKVRVIKDVVDSRGIIPDTLNYAKKVTGEYRTDRSVPIKPEVVERYVYDGNLSEYLSQGLNIKFGIDCAKDCEAWCGLHAVVNTAPMNHFVNGSTVYGQRISSSGQAFSDLRLASGDIIKFGVGSSSVEFKRKTSTCITAHLDGVDAYLSAYVSNPDTYIARISVTGSLLQIDIDHIIARMDEVTARKHIDEALELIGMCDRVDYEEVKVHNGINAKLVPIDERERKRIIMKLTDEFNIYSVGRQATWRPKLLLDDVVDDVRKVVMMLRGYPNKLVDQKEYSDV